MEWNHLFDWLEDLLPFENNMAVHLVIMLVGIALTYFAARFLLWFINSKILSRFFRKRKVDLGRQYALRQVVSYLIWALAVFAILEILGIGNVILASSAALLVGIGLGLQDTFKDLICGIVILVEGTVEIGDIIEIDGLVGEVKKIGLRVSKVNTRDNINIIVPNSRLVIDKVTNWSHEPTPTRFSIDVGVAYGTDVELAKKVLVDSALAHDKVLSTPVPTVQLIEFGSSSVDLRLLFFSHDYFPIEFVRSDIRFAIEQNFRKKGIQIPFPQMDLWVKNAEGLK